MRIAAVLLIVAVVLAGCETSLPTDKVQTADQAIEIGKHACAISSGGGVWSANLKSGSWIVRFDTPSDMVPDMPYAIVDVSASDGVPGHCGGGPY
jgi:hypothetical protein